jgi:3-hydroxyacyl-[acyl-carrier-protein] dehydratase
VKFVLVDRICEYVPGSRIVTQKALSAAEEYLADHFPAFPVMPGVLMLEAMVQASAWLVRETQDFARPLVLLKSARNVTYKSFVVPGEVLTVTAECKEITAEQSVFSAQGRVGDRPTVKGRLVLRHLALTDVDAELASVQTRLVASQRAMFGQLLNTVSEPAASV